MSEWKKKKSIKEYTQKLLLLFISFVMASTGMQNQDSIEVDLLSKITRFILYFLFSFYDQIPVQM